MNRESVLGQLRQKSPVWDVLVIGGGASGLGAAVDAASRGLKTLLLEGSDFAKATSSRSTKLIHGGFRYLKQGNLSLVRESLRERGLLLRNAPDLVRPLPFVLPVYSSMDRWFYGAGLKLYDLLAGKHGMQPSKFLSPRETLEALPTLRSDSLHGGIRYFDAQFDDARLAISLAQTLFRMGGSAINYCRVTSLLKSAGRIAGVAARDEESGETFELPARVVVNATGIFTDELRQQEDPGAKRLLTFSQGSHLVLDRSFLPGASGMMIPKTEDGRVLFAIPWHEHTLLGTTDVEVSEASLDPRPSEGEIEFLLQHAGQYLTKTPSRTDILSAFAGIRPLIASGSGTGKTSALSREHALVVSSAGLVSVAGGKWTTYRRMAEQTIDRALLVGGIPSRSSNTASLRLHSAEPASQGSPLLHPRLRCTTAGVLNAVRTEMARTVEDLLARRTRDLFLDARACLEAAPAVAKLLAHEFSKSDAWAQEEQARFCKVAETYLPTF